MFRPAREVSSYAKLIGCLLVPYGRPCAMNPRTVFIQNTSQTKRAKYTEPRPMPGCYRRSHALMATEKRIPPLPPRPPDCATADRGLTSPSSLGPLWVPPPWPVVSRGRRRHLDRLPPAPGFLGASLLCAPRGPASSLIWNGVSRLCCSLIYPVPPTSRGPPGRVGEAALCKTWLPAGWAGEAAADC